MACNARNNVGGGRHTEDGVDGSRFQPQHGSSSRGLGSRNPSSRGGAANPSQNLPSNVPANLGGGSLGFGPLSVPDLSPDPGSYEALADLFLGDGTLGPVAATASRREPEPNDAPTLKLAGVEDDAGEDVFVDEADLHEEDTDDAAIVTDRPRTSIELVIVGHLPVLASAWVMQYAARRADSLHAPVALLRVQQGVAQLDLIGPGAEEFRQPEALGLDAAMAAARAMTPHWIIRDEQPEEYAAEFTGLTVLTTADDSAVVACYRELKTRLGEDNGTRALRVGVLGAAPDKAREACGKIASAAKQFLGREVQIEDCGQKISPRNSVQVYRGECDMDAADIVAHLLDEQDAAAIVMPSVTPPVPVALPETPMDEIAAELPAMPEPASVEPVVTIAMGGMPESSPVQPLASESAALDAPVIESPARMPEIVVKPYPHAAKPAAERAATAAMPDPSTNPVASHTPRATATAADGMLARHIAGLRALPTRCPYAKEVQLAVDDAGRLHGLVYAAAGATVQSVEAASQRLTTVEAWAKAHRELLELGHPVLAATRGEAIVGYLLTDRPKDARVLLDTHLRIHLLTRVPTTAGEHWVCVELN